MPIHLFNDLCDAVFLSRPNRFAVIARVKRRQVTAYLPNPGRLRELLFPGTPILLERAGGKGRRTPFTVVAVDGKDGLIPLHTGKTNDLVAALLRAGAIARLTGWKTLRREVPVPHGRIDFLLGRGTERYYLEVKSCTLFAAGGAFFPDAVTARGRRHVLTLRELRARNVRCGVLFVVYNDRCRYFLPDWHTDPAFAEALVSAKDGRHFAARSLYRTAA